MQDGGRYVVDARDVFDAAEAGRKDRAQRRNAHLPAVRVAGQQQVGILGPRPSQLIGTVGQHDAERRDDTCETASGRSCRWLNQGRSLPVSEMG